MITINILYLYSQHSDHSKSLNKEKQLNSELLLQIKELNNEILKHNETIAADKNNNTQLLQEIEELKSQNTKLESTGKEIETKYEARINELTNELSKNNETIASDKNNSIKLLQEIEELKSQNSRLELTGKERETEYEARIHEKESENLDLSSKVNVLKETTIELDKIKLILQEKEQKLAEAENLLNIKNKEMVESLIKSEEKYLKLSTENEELQVNLKREFQALSKTFDETDVKLKQKEIELEVNNFNSFSYLLKGSRQNSNCWGTKLKL